MASEINALLKPGGLGLLTAFLPTKIPLLAEQWGETPEKVNEQHASMTDEGWRLMFEDCGFEVIRAIEYGSGGGEPTDVLYLIRKVEESKWGGWTGAVNSYGHPTGRWSDFSRIYEGERGMFAQGR